MSLRGILLLRTIGMFAQLIWSWSAHARSAIFAFIWYDHGAICGLLNRSLLLFNECVDSFASRPTDTPQSKALELTVSASILASFNPYYLPLINPYSWSCKPTPHVQVASGSDWAHGSISLSDETGVFNTC